MSSQSECPTPRVRLTRLPESVSSVVDCVRHEIGVIERQLEECYENDNKNKNTNNIENKENQNKNDNIQTESLEDAIDDGFMCVDLRVLERKLRAWHRLFSPAFCNSKNRSGHDYTVTPFFAIKCNPDPVVVQWLSRTASLWNLPLGFDCASIAELELAKAQIEAYKLNETTGRNGSVPTTRIVYANPQRAEADLMRALELFATKVPLEPDSSAPAATTTTTAEELWLTLDGIEEVYKIAIAREQFLEKHDPSKATNGTKHCRVVMPRIRIVLRIWVPDGHSQVPLGEKFGMRLDEIDILVGACLEAGIDHSDIIGISFHCGSGCESVETYLEALEMGRTAMKAIDQNLAVVSTQSSELPPPRCWLLDIGGGFPGLDGLDGDVGRFAVGDAAEVTCTEIPAGEVTGHPGKESAPQTTVADIAMAVRPVMRSLDSETHSNDHETNPHLTLIAEPGRYFVEGAFALASRIYQKQLLSRPIDDEVNTEDENKGDKNIRVYRIPHGVQGVFKDVLLCGESFVPQPLQTEAGEGQEHKLYPSRVVGPSGDDSEDVVCDSCLLPELKVDDWLVFDRMGAYTLSIASRAGRPVMRYVLGGDGDTPPQAENPDPKAFW